MIDTAIVGLGKMGISHLALLQANPKVNLVGACDGLGYLTKNLERYSGIRCFNSLEKMLDDTAPQSLVVATPTKTHEPIVKTALERGISVFCEKPFLLHPAQGEELIELADSAGLTTQVGYHYRFVSAFEKAQRIIAAGALGTIHHARIEAYGPVVTNPKGGTWRSKGEEGGGVVYDYACHAVDLVHFLLGPVDFVDGVIRKQIHSSNVDDEIYASMGLANDACAQLAVNWSDPSQRKMTTKVSVWGDRGSLSADRQECQVYLTGDVDNVEGLGKGWNSFNIVELTGEIDFYLRGEEYTKQLDYFADSVATRRMDGINNFRSALATDSVVECLLSYQRGQSTASGNQDVSLLRLMLSKLGFKGA